MKLRILTNGYMKSVIDSYNHNFQFFIRLVTYFLAAIFLVIPNPIIQFIVTGHYPVKFGIRPDLYFLLFLWMNILGLYRYPKLLFQSEILFYQLDTRMIIHRGKIIPKPNKIMIHEHPLESNEGEISWNIEILAGQDAFHIFGETGYRSDVDGIKRVFDEVSKDLNVEFIYMIHDSSNTSYNSLQLLSESILEQNRISIHPNKFDTTLSVSEADNSFLLTYEPLYSNKFLNFDNIFIIIYFGTIFSMFMSFMAVLQVKIFVYPSPLNFIVEIIGYIFTSAILLKGYKIKNPKIIQIEINSESLMIISKYDNAEVKNETVMKTDVTTIQNIYIEDLLYIQFLDINRYVLIAIPIIDGNQTVFHALQQMVYTKWVE